MSDEWTAADDRALAMWQLREHARRTLGFDPDGLTDDEVMAIVKSRIEKAYEAVRPVLDALGAERLAVR